MKKVLISFTVIFGLLIGSFVVHRLYFKAIIKNGIAIIKIIQSEGIISPSTRLRIEADGWKLYSKGTITAISKATGFFDEEVIVRLIDKEITAARYAAKSSDEIDLLDY